MEQPPYSVFLTLLILLLLAGFSGCTTTRIPGMADPVVGTWNGYVEESGTVTSILPEGVPDADDVASMRLNIYDDNTFDLASNYTLSGGSVAPTGKGNYVMQPSQKGSAKSYLHYNEAKDILIWETRGIIIEFRRNDKAYTRQDLIDYDNELLAAITPPPTVVPATIVTPVPTFEIASLQSEGFGYDTTTGIVYHFNGVLRTYEGVYQNVMVILRYPDKDEYHLNLGGMGGANFTKKDVQIVLLDRVKNMTPRFFIRLDQTEYPANVSLNITRDAGGNITANFTDSSHFSAFAPRV
jgi:hypothetical protein